MPEAITNNPGILTIIAVVVLLVVWVLRRLTDTARYEDTVREMLDAMDCPFYDFNICMDHYHAGLSPRAAAWAIRREWEDLND